MKFFQVENLRRGSGVKRKFSKKTLILVFEVIMQLPKHSFEITIFSSVQLIVLCREKYYLYLSYLCNMKYFLPYRRRNVCWKFGGTFLGTQELIYVSSARLQNFLWVYTFLSLMELRSSCPDSDFLLGLLLPEEDIIGCNRLQSFDEFTTSLAS